MGAAWKDDSCEAVQAYYTVYPVPVAAALWCGIPVAEVHQYLGEAKEIGRAIFQHPYIRCLEPRCRAIHEAIDKDVLPVSREKGSSFLESKDHVAPERRYVTRQNLKEWIAKEFPSDKPSFLFDEIERSTHQAINTEAFTALQADRDALTVRLEKAKSSFRDIRADLDAMRGERDSLRAIVEKVGAPSARAETTYLNIIAAMLELIQTPRGGRTSDSAVIAELVTNYGDKPGISKANLEKKFAEAKRSIRSC